MRKNINTIILINWYLTKSKLTNPDCESVKLLRKYLTIRIGHLINN